MKDHTQSTWLSCPSLSQLALLLGLSLGIATPHALAQDQTLRILRERAPAEDSLSVGFTPDPRSYQLSAGGSSLMNINPECVGYFAEQPEALILEYAGSDNLGIFVNADADTVLAVIDANGDLHCNDDHALLSNNNPGVQLSPAPEGRIAIMVGVYNTADIGTEATVVVTEFGPSMWLELDLGGDFNNLISNIASTDINFGDDSGSFANDGECDDPRFLGDGSAMFPSADHELHDASDCSVLYGLGQVQLLEQYVNAAPAPAAGPDASNTAFADIDFGDNSSAWANDGECDDPRFEGDGMASVTVEDDIRHDANDCQALYSTGAIHFTGAGSQALDLLDSLNAITGDLAASDDPGSFGGFADRFSFVARSGEMAVVSVSSSDFDTYLRVTSPSGEVFINDDYEASTDRSVIVIDTTEIGEYQVEVTSFGADETGSYTLQMGAGGGSDAADQV